MLNLVSLNSYHHPSGVSLSSSLPLELVQSGTFSFLNRPTQWRCWRWLRATMTLFLFLMPCHLRCQKNIRAWTALKVLSSIKPQMFQSQPHFSCTVHFYLQCLPSFQSKPPLQLSLLQENQVNHIKIESFTAMPLYWIWEWEGESLKLVLFYF